MEAVAGLRDLGIVLERERRIPLMLRGEGALRRSAADLQSVVLALPGANLHLYGKTDPRRGRKMGHVTFVAPTLPEAQASFERACAILGIGL